MWSRVAPRMRALPVLRRYPLTWVTSGLAGFRHRRDFDAVHGYVMFVGQPRTGHSLVGALLDAHPNALVAHELDALKYVEAGFDRRRLFALLQRAERQRVAAGHVSSTGYGYLVPNQWQGRHERLDVIGDKKGGRSTIRLGTDIALLDRLRRVVGVDLSAIQVVRNPYDVIATMHRRAPKRSLEDTAELFFELADTVDEVRRRLPAARFLEVHHDDLVAEPTETLAALCRFLGLDATADYLADCASILYSSPNRSRESVTWTPELLARIAARSAQHPSLARYRFDDLASSGEAS